MYEQILKFIMGGILIITLDYFAKKKIVKFVLLYQRCQ